MNKKIPQEIKKKQGSLTSLGSLTSQGSLTSPNNNNNNKYNNKTTKSTGNNNDLFVVGLLQNEYPDHKQLKTGIHKEKLFFSTVVYDKTHNKYCPLVVNSNKEVFVDYTANGRDKTPGITNEIRSKYNLSYKGSCEVSVLDTYVSNRCISNYIQGKNKKNILKEIYEKIISNNKKHIYYPDELSHVYVTLDIISTYFMAIFEAKGRTFIEAERGSGKTQQCRLYKLQSCNALMSNDISKASFFRLAENTVVTLIIDDFDDKSEEEKQQIMSLYKTGYKNTSKTIRVSEGNSKMLDTYRVYCHVVLNNTEGLDEISKSRSFILPILKTDDPSITKKDINDDDVKWKNITDDCYSFALENWQDVKKSYLTIKSELKGRQFEIMRPILAIAELIDPEIKKSLEDWIITRFNDDSIRQTEGSWDFLVLEYFYKSENDFIFTSEIGKMIALDEMDATDRRFKGSVKKITRWVGKYLSKVPLFQPVHRGNGNGWRLKSRRQFEKFLKTKGWLDLIKSSELSEVNEPCEPTNEIDTKVHKVMDFMKKSGKLELLLNISEQTKINMTEVESILKTLCKNGSVYEPRRQTYAVVGN